MESKPQNPEFKINPENFHPCIKNCFVFTKTYVVGTQKNVWLRPLLRAPKTHMRK